MSRVHLLLPGSRDRVRCGLPSRRVRYTSRVLSGVTCTQCLQRRDTPEGRLSGAAEYAMRTTIVGGQRREILPCECGAAMIAGLDHICDPETRRDGGLVWT